MMDRSKPRIIGIKPNRGAPTILIQVSEVEGDEGGITQAGPKMLNLEEMLQRIKPFCESIVTTIGGLSIKPNSASAEFGLKFSAKGNLFIVEASGEATIKVSLNWSL